MGQYCETIVNSYEMLVILIILVVTPIVSDICVWLNIIFVFESIISDVMVADHRNRWWEFQNEQ